MEVYHKPQRTRSTTWVPRRVYYVLRHLQRTLTPGQAQAISNKQIQLGVKFGSEGEVSQIMRWLSGELPTMGRWTYGCLRANAQTHRFITRERMPSGGYRVTLLPTPKRIDAPTPSLPDVVQLSFLDDPSVIPQQALSDAAEGGSFFHDPSGEADRQQQRAGNRRSARDQHEETPKESNKQQHGARVSKSDWSEIAISEIAYLPVAALEKAGVTPEIFQAADRKIATRCEYDRPAQVRILIRSLLSGQPIYSASEIAARSEDVSYERPSRSVQPKHAPHRDHRSRHDPQPNEERDAEFAAQLAEFERAAVERRAKVSSV